MLTLAGLLGLSPLLETRCEAGRRARRRSHSELVVKRPQRRQCCLRRACRIREGKEDMWRGISRPLKCVPGITNVEMLESARV